MDLTIKNNENIEYMLSEIKKKLQLVNPELIQPEAYSTSQYDDLFDLYQMISKKDQISVNEMQGIMDELRSLRNNN
ncbi:DUF1128 domain-containing protein [Tuberibacillus sp. Marseille-P3662]|uniref:DUF1128 domain-containing protein n=1 Tax=Tuberibacillus sp. Marseille-P3662 TaxID=1965358 RepID=UPI000A1C8912|nr:DUF1128 domain-containing protein [Tuberibacillus sp. Marseille-P3662]